MNVDNDSANKEYDDDDDDIIIIIYIIIIIRVTIYRSLTGTLYYLVTIKKLNKLTQYPDKWNQKQPLKPRLNVDNKRWQLT